MPEHSTPELDRAFRRMCADLSEAAAITEFRARRFMDRLDPMLERRMSTPETPTVQTSVTFTFGDSDDPHTVGDPECGAGWCGGTGYPAPCECGGLVHANFGDENTDGDYWIYRRCDRCGETG